jgi:hypothetical protein
VYSQHQLTSLPLVGNVASCFDHKPRREDEPLRLKAPTGWKKGWVKSASELRDIAISAAALEPIYHSRVVGKLTLRGRSDVADFVDFEQWRDGAQASKMLKWLGIDAEWLKQSGSRLLYEADRIDPLRDWSELVARADPDKWGFFVGARAARWICGSPRSCFSDTTTISWKPGRRRH